MYYLPYPALCIEQEAAFWLLLARASRVRHQPQNTLPGSVHKKASAKTGTFAFLLQKLSFIFISARRALNPSHKRYLCSLLGSGTLTAHRRICLVLLCSHPDTVHKVLLRKTQTSTPLTKGSSARIRPGARHHPCCSGLQVQGTAISPAVRKCYDEITTKSIPNFSEIVNHEINLCSISLHRLERLIQIFDNIINIFCSD